jgi:glucose-6-phosphate isomerase
MVFAYPSDSGQDYGIIEASQGMRHRVMATEDGGWELKENAAYLPRDASTAAAIMKTYA